MIRRLLPYPLLAIGLFVMWLLLTQSFSPGQVLLGILVTLFATRAMAALQPERSPIRSYRTLFSLARDVIGDIILSNIAVARLILSPRKKRVSGFIRLPLTLSDRHGLALLALIITATPGTIWVDFNRRRGMLLIHVLDLVDEEAWIQLIKTRYEARLMEIFES